ncbi:hypothetical protein J2Z40_000181 [Cytobacillus eiseniae]|uniref:Uncharacterized protein n=1 Tax=Cytobacillus eiseniae TaxID=762947 RepID=A0ABS4R9Q5_9BACI|nr:hypothetical protein [Cytobacillus eiseniae]MBP2239628.1 hypothetical protein [Cytobacillus eiseniae]
MKKNEHSKNQVIYLTNQAYDRLNHTPEELLSQSSKSTHSYQQQIDTFEKE